MNLETAQPWLITTFYKFIQVQDIEKTKTDVNQKAKDLGIRGLMILGAEGFNCTCCAADEKALTEFKNFITSYFEASNLQFKDSKSSFAPFKRFKVKEREEIVTIGEPGLFPTTEKNHHLTPEQWNHVLKNESDFVLVDTRNWYETKIGTFKGALAPAIEEFSEFPKWVESQNIAKDKKMLIFCTGGIRCEKGILELQRQGYDQVYQLDGGILKYIEEYPNDQFEGECFVFDARVAVDQNLQPSTKFKLCPHCGQPAEMKITCVRCDYEGYVCDKCHELDFKKDTCSKNCAYWWEMNPGQKGAHQFLWNQSANQ